MDDRSEEQVERERILAILEHEPIRFIGGRYSDGFVDVTALHDLVIDSQADMRRPPVGQQSAFPAMVVKKGTGE